MSDDEASMAKIDLNSVKNKKTVDKRANKTPDEWRMLVLMARDAEPENALNSGHAFIAAMTYRDDLQSFDTNAVFGLYPVEGSTWGVINAPAEVEIKEDDQYPSSALIVWTNKAQHASALALKDNYARQGDFTLIFNDCVSFMKEIATLCDLEQPSTDDRLYPIHYVNGLIDKN